ncbi:hypothetical protein LO763_11660 [Glycomyces sp. A-F 0318]|uniref:DddA-like double-stranded DNA deaminase toxin n=1 Tax=Glycomyces amatae TaxID=2881355 RepID=UPI001E28FFE0|nr:DddA-like double-stranded DNA deaminase toxin [Glycomyces amatae]MCD0444278.1 hypothetical protein [Glycomyces amatae]
MASIGDVAAVLRAARAMAEEATQAVKAASDKLERVLADLGAMLEASSNPDAHEGQAQMRAAHRMLGEVLAALASGNTTMGDYVASIAGSGGTTSSSATAGSRPAAGSDSAVPSAVTPSTAIPPLVQRLAQRLPVWDEDEPTLAYAYTDEDGVETEFRSGRDAAAKTGLKPDYANRWIMDHAEAKTAAAIRAATSDQRVTMVINKEPCQGVKGCDATLPAIIPARSSVTVYLRDGDGVSFYRHYEGNGEGIEHDA